MTQIPVERRSPVRQGGYDRVRVTTTEEERNFIPLTEDDLIISYSLAYKIRPDKVVEAFYKNFRLSISLYTNTVESRLFTHSIEQYDRRDGPDGKAVYVKWFRVSVFHKNDIDIEEVKNNLDRALIFSRIFKTRGNREQKNMTQERTTNLFGRVFANITEVRNLLFDRDTYGHSLADVILKMSRVVKKDFLISRPSVKRHEYLNQDE